jgi:hypothetical protein
MRRWHPRHAAARARRGHRKVPPTRPRVPAASLAPPLPHIPSRRRVGSICTPGPHIFDIRHRLRNGTARHAPFRPLFSSLLSALPLLRDQQHRTTLNCCNLSPIRSSTSSRTRYIILSSDLFSLGLDRGVVSLLCPLASAALPAARYGRHVARGRRRRRRREAPTWVRPLGPIHRSHFVSDFRGLFAFNRMLLFIYFVVAGKRE